MNHRVVWRFTLLVLLHVGLAVGALRGADLVDVDKVRAIKDVYPKSLAFTLDGKRLISGGESEIKIWDVAEGVEIRTLKAHSKGIKTLAVSRDGKQLISGSWDASADAGAVSVKIWNLTNKADMPEDIVTKDTLVHSVALSPNEKYFATGGREKTLRIWDFPSGKLRVEIDAHPRDVQCVAFSPDSKMLASCGYDSETKLWDPETGQPIGTIPNVGTQFHWDAVAFSPDGKSLAMSGSGLRALNFEGKEIFNVRPDKVQTMSLCWSPDGKLIASGGLDKLLKIWDAATGKELAALAGHRGAIGVVRFSPDGRLVATCASNDDQIRLWPLNTPAAPKAE